MNSDAAELGQIVEQMLALIPQPVAQLIRLGSLPHRLTPEVIRLLAQDADMSDAFGGWLGRLSLAQVDEDGSVVYHTRFRDVLRVWLLTRERVTFEDANRQLHEYFASKAIAAGAADRLICEQEAFYHLIQCDPETAFRRMRAQFEELLAAGQTGHVEQLVARATELRGFVDHRFIGWIEFWRARIALRNGNHESARTIFSTWIDGGDPLLCAVSTWGVGLVESAESRWRIAIGIFHDVLAQLDSLDDRLYTTYVYLSVGHTYHDLAMKSGGLGERTDSDSRYFWQRVEHLPFDTYAALAGRLNWLPTLYVSPNYQDWIVYYLLRRSRKWYRRAARLSKDHANTDGLFIAERMVAQIDADLGRDARALKRYELLLATPRVQSSKYRSARTWFGMGMAYQSLGRATAAQDFLRRSVVVFQEYRDHHSAGHGLHKLGDSYAGKGQIQDAVEAYTGSINAYSQSSDIYARTSSVVALEDLKSKVDGEPSEPLQLDSGSDEVAVRAYVARFPDRLMRVFQRISLLVALPIAFLSVLFLAFTLTATVWNIEGGIRLWAIGEPFSHAISRSAIMLAIVILGFLLIFWLYRLAYAVVGSIVVAILGRTLVAIEREQPTSYMLDPEKLIVNLGTAGDHHEKMVQWQDFLQIVNLDYCRWRTSIQLYSSMLILLRDQTIISVPASTNHYQNLQAAVIGNAGPNVKISSSEFNILRSWTSILALGAAMAVACARIFMNDLFGSSELLITRAVAEGRQHVPLWITTTVLVFSVALPLIFLTILLWRLWLHQYLVNRSTAYRFRTLPMWFLLVLALISTAFLAYSVHFLMIRV